jgi:NADPH:quinone reductase-like Zn-dependent oxidoreductase
MKNILTREMTKGWHLAWAITYLTIYVAMFGSGYLQEHVVWLGQQVLAFGAGSVVTGVAVRLWGSKS